MSEDTVIVTLLGAVIAAILLIIIWSIYAALHVTSGTVVEKYYDDKDITCAKTCIISPECWTIRVEGNRFDSTSCVSEKEYRAIHVGDYFTE